MVAALVVTCVACVADCLRQRLRIAQLEDALALADAAARGSFTSLDQRVDNLAFVERQQVDRHARDKNEASDEFVAALFDDTTRGFPHGHDVRAWSEHLDLTTPEVFQGSESDSAPEWCTDLSAVVLTPDESAKFPLSQAARSKAQRSLINCGYDNLDNFYAREEVEALRRAYVTFRESEEAEAFRYPCQGEGRVEHMLPFRPPFNTSIFHTDDRLLQILGDFLKEQIKLELMTVITSPPGSQHQRWHQGWRYLFHPDERLPPYAAVVTLPLADVSPEMGPSEMCPGKKRRFYYGWRCDDFSIRVASTAGTVAIFDYK